jgi:hypothetical protein
MPEPRTQRDFDITVTAYLKSIIESGADPKNWENLLKQALKLHFEMVPKLMGSPSVKPR